MQLSQATLRVTIEGDSAKTVHLQEGKSPLYRSGVTINDCSRVSRDLSTALEVHENLLPASFRLEVSSPGVERPLYSFEEYKRFVGFKIKLRTLAPLEGKRTFLGTLLAYDDERDCLEMEDGKRFHIPRKSIEKANLVFA